VEQRRLSAGRLVRFRAGPDRVSCDPLEEDRDSRDDETEAEQPPVRGNPATPARCLGAHR
jgi:hypothetical protein